MKNELEDSVEAGLREVAESLADPKRFFAAMEKQLPGAVQAVVWQTLASPNKPPDTHPLAEKSGKYFITFTAPPDRADEKASYDRLPKVGVKPKKG